jgi:hypothetical protein
MTRSCMPVKERPGGYEVVIAPVWWLGVGQSSELISSTSRAKLLMAMDVAAWHFVSAAVALMTLPAALVDVANTRSAYLAGRINDD